MLVGQAGTDKNAYDDVNFQGARHPEAAIPPDRE